MTMENTKRAINTQARRCVSSGRVKQGTAGVYGSPHRSSETFEMGIGGGRAN